VVNEFDSSWMKVYHNLAYMARQIVKKERGKVALRPYFSRVSLEVKKTNLA